MELALLDEHHDRRRRSPAWSSTRCGTWRPDVIGCFESRSITPCAARCATLPRRATIVTAPARSPAAMRRWIISADALEPLRRQADVFGLRPRRRRRDGRQGKSRENEKSTGSLHGLASSHRAEPEGECPPPLRCDVTDGPDYGCGRGSVQGKFEGVGRRSGRRRAAISRPIASILSGVRSRAAAGKSSPSSTPMCAW